ncbi:hypothetical protein BJF90_13265 [Pseudonocardia sp. CNS-004]|nr:hypothetical protein BJF90_13265 [Pseudonocardia sp. CNS-004]
MRNMVRKTRLELNVLRASMMTWPSPSPTPTASATRTMTQAAKRLSRRVRSRPGMIDGRTTRNRVCARVAPSVRATLCWVWLTLLMSAMVPSVIVKKTPMNTMKRAGPLPTPRMMIEIGSQAIGEMGARSVTIGMSRRRIGVTWVMSTATTMLATNPIARPPSTRSTVARTAASTGWIPPPEATSPVLK